MVSEFGWAPTGILFGISFMLTVTWVKAYLSLKKQALEILDLSGDPTTKIKIEDDCLEVSSNVGSRRLKWEKINRIEKSKDFLIPMSKSVPLICIPLESLPPEMEQTIFERAK